jgi:hypothetical protein
MHAMNCLQGSRVQHAQQHMQESSSKRAPTTAVLNLKVVVRHIIVQCSGTCKDVGSTVDYTILLRDSCC